MPKHDELPTHRPDPSITILTADPGLHILQTMVGGDIRIVPGFNRWNGKPCTVLVDADGMMKSRPVNVAATEAWYQQAPQFRGHDFLVGDVVIVLGGIH